MVESLSTMDHYGLWWAIPTWIVLYGSFLFFIPFYQKAQRKPTTAYMAFVVAYAFEMFGIPMSLYFVAGVFGYSLPDGVFWGHTLNQYIGEYGMVLCNLMSLAGLIMIIVGWREIYHNYWKHKDGTGKLVTTGIYRFIRHPQYTAFLMVTLGFLFSWATIPLLIMWPILFAIYYRLAKKEEAEMIEEFGNEYRDYMKRTNMFLPFGLSTSG